MGVEIPERRIESPHRHNILWLSKIGPHSRYAAGGRDPRANDKSGAPDVSRGFPSPRGGRTCSPAAHARTSHPERRTWLIGRCCRRSVNVVLVLAHFSRVDTLAMDVDHASPKPSGDEKDRHADE
jgi:hypothetical protein